MSGLVGLIEDKTISGKIAKDVFEILWAEGGDPAKIVEDRGLKQSPIPAPSKPSSTNSSPTIPTRPPR